MSTTREPVWRTALSGAQILFVAFGATVLVPLLTGLNPSLALLGAGIGTLVFQLCTKRQVPIYLGSSFAFIAPVIYSAHTWGMPATLGALASASFFYYVAAGLVKWRGVNFIHHLLVDGKPACGIYDNHVMAIVLCMGKPVFHDFNWFLAVFFSKHLNLNLSA